MKTKISFEQMPELATGLRIRAASDEKMKYELLGIAEQLEKIVQDGALIFPQLFDLDGNPVDARLVSVRNRWNPDGVPTWRIKMEDGTLQWVTAFPKRTETMRRKGYAEGRVFRAMCAVYDETAVRLEIIPLDIVDYEIDN